MQDLARGAALAYNASVVLRIGSAVFVVCPDERLQSLYYRVDGGVRSVWRHLRGSEISPRLLQDAEEANRKLWERAPALPLPRGVPGRLPRDPRLALIRPEISTDGERLTLHGPSPGPDPVAIDVNASGRPRRAELFKAPFRGIDQGDEVAAWLSDVLGAPSRLVRLPADHNRVTDGRTPGTSGYADSCAVVDARQARAGVS